MEDRGDRLEGTGSRGRVLFLSPQPFFAWRGSPIRVGFDVQALVDLGFEVDLLVMPVGEDRELPGVRLFRAPNVLRAKRLAIGPSPAKAVLDLALLFRARQMIRRERYAVVHGVEEAGAMAVLLARRVGARSVFEKHSDPASHRGGRLRNAFMAGYARVEAWTIRRVDAVIGTGPGLVEQAVRRGAQGKAFHVPDIPSSRVEADPDRAADVRRRLLAGRAGPLAMYVGSFAGYQGVDLMFRSFPAAARAVPSMRFAVIGGSQAEEARWQAWLGEQGVAEAVTFPDRVPPDDLPHVLGAADILLSPRRAGTNTPLKLLDYFKAGGAVVACDSAANRLLLDDACAVLTPATPEAFAEGTIRLARDAALRRRVADEGRRRVREAHSYAAFKEGIRRCYEAVLPPVARREDRGRNGTGAS